MPERATAFALTFREQAFTSGKLDKALSELPQGYRTIGNLPFKTTEEDLNSLFSQVGPVESVSIITDRDTGRSKGFGFVSMGSEDADKAIAQFNGQEWGGRALTVNEARPMVKKEGGFSNRNYR